MVSTKPTSLRFATAEGPARVSLHRTSRRRRGSLVLGHGAGGGIEAWDLQVLATVLPSGGFDVLLVEQPWRVAGRRLAVMPPRLDRAWVEVMDALRRRSVLGDRVIVGGRSAGARVACRTALETSATGVLALAFPLHPPGRPDKSRAGELASGLPTRVVQGARDPFGNGHEVARFLPGDSVVEIPGADHSFAVAKTALITRSEAAQMIIDGCLSWLSTPVLGESTRRVRR